MVFARAIECLIVALSGSSVASALHVVSNAEHGMGIYEFSDPKIMESYSECDDIESGGPDWDDESLNVEDWR
eukprot:3857079-Pyramimonas_sp.AAC.1